MQFLPNENDIRWITENLRDLIEKRGYEQFVRGPILLPDKAFFPDAWQPDATGAGTVALRLMKYAKLTLDASICVLSEDDMPENSAALYMGTEDGVCSFGILKKYANDPMVLTAALAHEVTHAYRDFHRLENDPDEEEHLTDLTAVYLGFGLLTLNAAYRYRSSGHIEGQYAYLEYSHSTLGYLPIQGFAYATALQCAVQGTDTKMLSKMKQSLESNQRACFSEALRYLTPNRAELLRALKIPREELWPKRNILETAVAPLDRKPIVEYDALQEKESDGVTDVNKDRPIFRLRQDRRAFGTWIGVLLGLVVGLAVGVPAKNPWILFGALGVALGMGRIWGASIRFDICSDPQCETHLPANLTSCPKCGGKISGRIQRAKDRLDAEEALLEGTYDGNQNVPYRPR